MILCQEVPEIVEVEVGAFAVTSNWNEEADEEQGHAQKHKDESIFQCSPEASAECLRAVFLSGFVVFFVPEVSEGDDQQAEHRVDGVKSIVDNLQCFDNPVNFILTGPVLSATKSRASSTRDKSNVDR